MATQSDREIDWEIARLSGGLNASRRAEPAHQGSLQPSDWDLGEPDVGARSEAISDEIAVLLADKRPIIESIAPVSMGETIVEQSELPHASAAVQTRRSGAENAFLTAAAAGMSVLAVGLVAILALTPAPPRATSASAAQAPSIPSTLGVVREGLPVASRPVLTLDPVLVSADSRRTAPIAGAPHVAARVAQSTDAVVAPSPDAIPPQLVIPPLASAAPSAAVDLSRPAAALAIAMAGRRAASCTSIGADDDRATMHVSVTFAPSGRATSASVLDGPFEGTAVGSCVTRVLRDLTVARFDGEPVTVRSSLRLR